MTLVSTPQAKEKKSTAAVSPNLEKAAIYHAGFLAVFASWSFGGNVGWAENVLIVLGGMGSGITALEFVRRRRNHSSLRPFFWLSPLIALAALVLFSALYPNLQFQTIEATAIWFRRDVSPFLPSSARPAVAVHALLLFVALFFPSFNIAVVVRSRRLLRSLLWTMVINAVALAVFGSLQKLSHASGLYFGTVPSPNTRFFASFIYQNHWGAFALLHLSIGLGLLFDSKVDPRYRSFFQSPVCLALVGLLLLAASVPLSASRSCTVLAGLLLGIALVTTWKRIKEGKLVRGAGVFALTGVALLVLLAAILARPVMQSRLADTREQLSQFHATGSIGSRGQLYGQTWEMAKDRLLFGWGLGSYPWVFTRYNRQVSTDRLPVYYEDAHSDWLQSLAEIGLAGTLCRGLLLLLPLLALRHLRPLSATSSYLLLGCTVILFYAAVEFPFGNAAVVLVFWLCWFAAIRFAQLDARETGG